jgi:hypothetical protein
LVSIAEPRLVDEGFLLDDLVGFLFDIWRCQLLDPESGILGSQS